MTSPEGSRLLASDMAGFITGQCLHVDGIDHALRRRGGCADALWLSHPIGAMECSKSKGANWRAGMWTEVTMLLKAVFWDLDGTPHRFWSRSGMTVRIEIAHNNGGEWNEGLGWECSGTRYHTWQRS